MDLRSAFRRLFGADDPPRPASAQTDAVSTAVLEPAPEPGSEVSPAPEVEAPQNAWWIPREEATLPAPPASDATGIDRELYNQLVRILDDPSLELPQIPQVAQRALVMLRDKNVSFHHLSDLVEQDPVLTAEVLKVANSVAYRGMSEILRLDQAFARIGQRALRSMILAMTFKGVAIRTGGPDRTLGEELWHRSLASGTIMSEMGPRYGLRPDDAFLIGLLHDIGMLAVLKVAHDYQKQTGSKTPRAVFDRVCGEWHEHIGLRLAGWWNLPEPLPDLIGNHHRAAPDGDPLQTYRQLITFGDVCCAMLEHAPYVPYDFFNLPCVQALGLEDNAETHELLGSLPDAIAERLETF